MQNRELALDISTANPKQIKFFKSRKKFIGYGGARGGGKTWALQHKIIMLCLRYGGIRILLLRRTYPELQENHISRLRSMLNGYAKYTDTRKLFEFPNGSTIKCGYCQSESDTLQYQGQEYDIIAIDECTQFTYKQFSDLTACVRGANDFPKRMYLTMNPGGPLHSYCKRVFISREYEGAENPEDYDFIFANVEDNKILMEKDPDYVKMLDNLPDDIRAAWRDGNWDAIGANYFSCFNRSIHVVEPFSIPEYWKRYRGIDYGLDGAACVFVAVSDTGEYYVYKEYLEADKPIAAAAADICSLTGNDEKIEYTAAPTDMWTRTQESGKTKADLFYEAGLPLIKSSNNREAGWLSLLELMQVHQNGDEKYSRLKIFSNCRHLIGHLTELQRDPKKPTDCSVEPHEITHLPDALRYISIMFMSPSKKPKAEENELAREKRKAIKGGNTFKRYW